MTYFYQSFTNFYLQKAQTTTERIYCNRNKSTDDLFAENATNLGYGSEGCAWDGLHYYFSSLSFVGICLLTAV